MRTAPSSTSAISLAAFVPPSVQTTPAHPAYGGAIGKIEIVDQEIEPADCSGQPGAIELVTLANPPASLLQRNRCRPVKGVLAPKKANGVGWQCVRPCASKPASSATKTSSTLPPVGFIRMETASTGREKLIIIDGPPARTSCDCSALTAGRRRIGTKRSIHIVKNPRAKMN